MTSPSRQVGSRKLPPLPGVKRGSSPGVAARQLHSPRELYTRSPYMHAPVSARYNGHRHHHHHHPEMIITGHSPINGSHYYNRQYLSSRDGRLSVPELTPEMVRSYLRQNPDFLDHFIMNHVNQTQLEKWVIRRAQKRNKQRYTHRYRNGIAHRNEQKSNLIRWKISDHGEKQKMLQELTRDVHDHTNREKVLVELVNCAASAVSADGHNLYLIDDINQEILFYDPEDVSVNKNRKIGPGSTLAAFVAREQIPVCCNEIRHDENFPEGVPFVNGNIIAVLCHPIIQTNGELIGIMELYKNTGSFTKEEESIVSSYIVWGAIALYYAEMYLNITRQRKLNEFLLTVTKSIFQDIVSMDTVIMKVMNYAQKLVSADRASLFLVDNKTNELYARIFDIGNGLGTDTITAGQKEIRFPIDKGVAGHVASTGEILNISDAYADERFNREIDVKTGYTTKTILCMPIFIRGSVIGVVQMVNKLNGNFTRSDEESFETFAIYCGLALHHAKLYDKIRRSEQKYKVALEVLTYHSMCSEDEVNKFKVMPIPENIPDICGFEYSPWKLSNDEKPLHVIYMFKDLFGLSRFDLDHLLRFTLTVRKNYRRVPYHNWTHGFSVCNSMYTIIKESGDIFRPLERLALFVAALCHDLDHRGKTNQFMIKSASPLAAIYSTSTLEHHHFNQTVAILQVLQQEGHNILKSLTSNEYKQVLGNIKHCILATDLALFFPNKAKLNAIVDKGEFSWSNEDHRLLLQAIAMTGSDLCASVKPWEVQVETVKVIFEEFYEQGDLEKAAGQDPIPMMDRNKAHELPANQVGFINGICLPCYELMEKLIPGTKAMTEGARANLGCWKKLADEQKIKEEETKNEAEEAEKKDEEKTETEDKKEIEEDKKETEEDKKETEENKTEDEKKENEAEEEKTKDGDETKAQKET